MTDSNLNGEKIALLAACGSEKSELTRLRKSVKKARATVELVSLKSGTIQGMNYGEKANTFPIDRTVDEVNYDDHDRLVLLGGVANPDSLRTAESQDRTAKSRSLLRGRIKVARDKRLVTSRCRGDLDAFCKGVAEFVAGQHTEQLG